MADTIGLRAVQNFWTGYVSSLQNLPPQHPNTLQWRVNQLKQGAELLLQSFRRHVNNQELEVKRVGHLLAESGWTTEREGFRAVYDLFFAEFQKLGSVVYNRHGPDVTSAYEGAGAYLSQFRQVSAAVRA